MSMADEDFPRCGHEHGGPVWWCTRPRGHTGSCAAEPYVGQSNKRDPSPSSRQRPLSDYIKQVETELTDEFMKAEGVDESDVKFMLDSMYPAILTTAIQLRQFDITVDTIKLIFGK